SHRTADASREYCRDVLPGPGKRNQLLDDRKSRDMGMNKKRRSKMQRSSRSFEEPVMSRSLWPLAAACALLSLPFLGATPALAVSPVTFVSGKGTNAGTCASPEKPCRTFQFALGQTSPGGEIKALDPANYGGVGITKSISLTGVEGASINRTTGDDII